MPNPSDIMSILTFPFDLYKMVTSVARFFKQQMALTEQEKRAKAEKGGAPQNSGDATSKAAKC